MDYKKLSEDFSEQLSKYNEEDLDSWIEFDKNIKIKDMKELNYVDGDLISLALYGHFDVIAHGCNCFCTMGAGIAPKMAAAFGCDNFPMEQFENK